jgi:hypothetical protein
MPLSPDLLTAVMTEPPAAAWGQVADALWAVFSATVTGQADAEVVRRDRDTTELDNALSGSAWELWDTFEQVVPRASQGIVEFWERIPDGKAILILDGLSLREVPWLLGGIKKRNYKLHQAGPRGAELPADTTSFAHALGFGQRSHLENNGAGSSHRLPGAVTESCNIPWQECVGQVGAHPEYVLWHHWPDERMHGLAGPGDGVRKLAKEAQALLTSDDFWALVEWLATGRRLVITGDHGYAATGLFPDLGDKHQADHMKAVFKSGRSCPAGGSDESPWLPPVERTLTSAHGTHRYVLGRRKWKSAAGYPTLQHGGLSVLEVFVPFIELSK